MARHLRALLWKNSVLLRRAPVALLCDVILPIALLMVMVAVWSAFADATLPDRDFSAINNMRVPPLAVLPLRLRRARQQLAVTASTPAAMPAAEAFCTWAAAAYPGLNASGLFEHPRHEKLASMFLPPLSEAAGIVRRFASEAALEAHVRAGGYAEDGSRLWGALVFHSGPPHWDYSLRLNASEVPATTGPAYDPLQRDMDPQALFQYAYPQPSFGDALAQQTPDDPLLALSGPGFSSLQLAVDRFILASTAADPAAACARNPWGMSSACALLASGNATVNASSLEGVELGVVSGPSAVNDVGWLVSSMVDPALGEAWQSELSALYAASGNWTDPDAAAAARARLDRLELATARFLRAEAFLPQMLSFVPFPVRRYTSNGFHLASGSFLPLFLVLSFLHPLARMVRGVTGEKEARLREALQLMGVGDGPMIASWLVTYGSLFAVIAALAAAVMKATFFARTDGGLLFLLMLLFGWASVAFCFAISACFSRARTATSLGMVAYLATAFPYYGVSSPLAAPAAKLASALAGPTAFSLTIGALSAMESGGRGVTWANAGSAVQGFAPAHGLAMLAADVLLYLSLGVAVEKAARWGVLGAAAARVQRAARTLACELCTSRASGPACSKRSQAQSPAAPPSAPAGHENPFFKHEKRRDSTAAPGAEAELASATEPLSPEQAALVASGRGVRVRGLRKTFPTPDGPRTVVDGVDLDLVEGQILCLLGANGAGKTTTIRCITAADPAAAPTKGSVTVFGQRVAGPAPSTPAADAVAQASAADAATRRDLGVCPQQDVLWPSLTVREHLQLFASLKGVPAGPAMAAAVAKAVQEVALADKLDARADALSGGQKRKLCVAIAFVGGSRLCILDEPTSGMDPYSRRSLWSMLQSAKEGRTILLTTHFLDEAQVLGDRTAIMSGGRIVCCGSPFFLKRHYNVGYLLSVTLASVLAGDCGAAGAESSADVLAAGADRLLRLSRKHVRDATLRGAAGAEVTVRLPLGQPLASLVEELERRSGELGVASFAVGVTSLEDVFMRVVGEGEKAAEAEAEGATHGSAADGVERPAAPNLSEGEDDGDGAEAHTRKAKAGADRSSTPGAPIASLAVPSYRTAVPPALLAWRQFRALFLKRVAIARRDLRALCYILLVPVVAVAAGLALLRATLPGEQPSLQLTTAALNVDADSNPFAPRWPHLVPAFSFKTGSSQQFPLGSPGTEVPSSDIASLLRCAPDANVSHASPLLHSTEAALRAGYALLGLRVPWRNASDWPVVDQQQQQQPPSSAPPAPPASVDPFGFIADAGAWHAPVSAMSSWLLATAPARGGSVFTAWVLGGGAGSGWEGMMDYNARNATHIWSDEHAGGVGRGLPLTAVPFAPAHGVASVTLLVNTTARHIGPLSQNLLSSSLLAQRHALSVLAAAGRSPLSGGGDACAAAAALTASVTAPSITTRNHPLPFTAAEKSLLSGYLAGSVATIALIALAFLPAMHAAAAAREVQARVKHLQLLAGVPLMAYHAASWCFDALASLVPAAAILVLFVAFDVSAFASTAAHRLEATAILLLLCALAAPSFAAFVVVALRPATAPAAQSQLLMLGLLSVGCMIVNMILTLGVFRGSCDVRDGLFPVFSLLPGFQLGSSLYRLAFLPIFPSLNANCARARGEAVTPDMLRPIDALSWQGTGASMAALAIEAVGYLALAVALDAARSHPSAHALARGVAQAWAVLSCRGGASGRAVAADAAFPGALLEHDDADVAAEAARACSSAADGAAIRLQRLRKVYYPPPGTPGQPKLAVRGLSFAVPAGECFGFLGVNGAGKSTTLSILTGDALPTSGSASIVGNPVTSVEARRSLGYAPQHEALLGMLTVAEQLLLYARLRGGNDAAARAEARAVMRQLGLARYRNRISDTLSGGSKRRLAVAIALIGQPRVLFLDEPSSGVDIVSRRRMWAAITEAAHGPLRSAVMLTTHSLEEAEALCSRIGVMLGGRLRAVGTPSQLRSKLGSAFTLEVRVKQPPPDAAPELAETMARALLSHRGAISSAPPPAPDAHVSVAVPVALGSTSPAGAMLVAFSELPAIAAALGCPELLAELRDGSRGAKHGDGAAHEASGAQAAGAGSGWMLLEAFRRSQHPAPPASVAAAGDAGLGAPGSPRAERVADASWLALSSSLPPGLAADFLAAADPALLCCALPLIAVAEWWAKEDAAQRVMRFVAASFPGAVVQERQGGGAVLHFSLPLLPPARPSGSTGGGFAAASAGPSPPEPLRLSTALSALERAASSLPVEAFSLSHATLEGVFNAFCRAEEGGSAIRGAAAGTFPLGRGRREAGARR